MKRILLSIFLAAAALSPLRAQFYLTGDDPGQLKWKYIQTPNYKIIYPRGTDSLARRYAIELETARPLVGLSAGFLPGQTYWGKTQVVLHPFTGAANGSVSWAPMRMDLYTLPEAYNPEPMPWLKELAVHENRHVAQLQFGNDGLLKIPSILFGEAATGLFAGLFPSTWMLEGDAVVAETALSRFGRGRNADFLSYYMMAFDKGDMRSWEQWRWGSYRRYAPNHYALGYLTIAGARYLYNDALFTQDYLKLAAHHPFKASKVRKWFKERSGKGFDASFADVMLAFKGVWDREREARGPFDVQNLIVEDPSWYTTYSGLTPDGNGGVYAVKSSFTQAAVLVSIAPNGQEKTIRPFASKTSALATESDGSVLWTEAVPNRRWSLAATSRLQRLKDGKISDLSGDKRYFNPAVGPGEVIAVTEYPTEGGSAIVTLGKDGGVLGRICSPDGIQFVEATWLDGRLAVSYTGPGGFGLSFLQADGSVSDSLLPQQPVSINHLKNIDGKLYFISDRDGVSQVYGFGADGALTRVTNARYGVTDYAVSGGTLFYAARYPNGNLVCSAALENLPGRPSDANSYHSYAIADTLSSQERRLALAKGLAAPDDAAWDGEISEPRGYSKLLNAIRIHSWVPLSIDYEAVSDLSSDETLDNLRLGASVLFQNTLGTLSGLASYAYDSNKKGFAGKKRHHSFHLDFTYTGLYPVIELSADLGDRDSYQYKRVIVRHRGSQMERLLSNYIDQPHISVELKSYIPFNFSRNGWNRGIIPQVKFIASNDRYLKGASIIDGGNGKSTDVLSVSYEEGRNVLMQALNASVRGYIMRPVAHSQVYPSAGIGAEVGYHTRLSLSDLYSPSAYGYVYGYLPGLRKEQGLKLTALAQVQFSALHAENGVKTRPRGLNSDDINSFLSLYTKRQLRLTADYAIPFWLGDIKAFSPLAYIKNFVFTPHADYTAFRYGNGLSGNGALYSVGADLTACLANLLWFPYDCQVGLSFNYNGGKSWDLIKTGGLSPERTSVSLVFKTSL